MKGAVIGGIVAGFLTGVAGVSLAIVFVPESNLAPILGFILAPPAGILGMLMGGVIGDSRISVRQAGLLGCLVGGLAGALLVTLGAQSSPQVGLGVRLFYVAIGIIDFGATAALVRRICPPELPK